MRNVILVVLGLLMTFMSMAQSTPNPWINGKIFDSTTKEAVESANVYLFQTNDSSLILQTLSETDGSFHFDGVKAGRYFLKTHLIGYADKTVSSFQYANKNLTLENVLMEKSSVELKEVVITGKKQFVELQADRMVINPEATITTASDNVLDVLAKSPGIVVDKDGNIIVKGKSGVKVMIDDKLTYLSGEQLAATLKNLQATAVEKIEIIENPPAKYDAEGNSGIINIRTKRGKIKGYNGSLSLNSQFSTKYYGNIGANLNYRNEKWNIYGNAYTGVNNYWNTVDLNRHFPSTDEAVFNEDHRNNGHTNYFGTKVGVDYYLSKNHIIGMMGKVSGWDEGDDGTTKTTIFNSFGSVVRQENTRDKKNDGGSDYLINLNYKWTIDTLGRSLSADADYAYYTYDSRGDMKTTYLPLQNPFDIKNQQNSFTNILSMKVDYEHPISQKTRVDAGLKTSQVFIDNDLIYNQYNHTNNLWEDPRKMSNRFKYNENINALYANFKHTFSEKWDMQLGLRGEQTRSKGNNLTMDSINYQNYFNLFPTVFLQNKLSENNQINLSYSYRIGRPNYNMLNPFVWMLNPYTYNQGNPLLQPQFTHSIKLGYSLLQKYILSVGYSATEDRYMQVFEQNNETKISVVAWRNLGSVKNMDATLSIPVNIGKWCQINANMTGFYQHIKSPLLNSMLDESQFTFQGNLITGFILPQDWSIELSGGYTSKFLYGMIMFKPMASMNMGIKKQLFNKKATLNISLSDVFHSRTQSYYSTGFQDLEFTGIQKQDTRRLQVTLVWRFGKDNIKEARQRSTSSEEESGRTGK